MASPALPPASPTPPERATRPKMQRAYVGLAEAATYLDVDPKTLRRLIAAGELAAYRLGNRVIKIRLADLDALLTPVPAGVRGPFPWKDGNGGGDA